VSGDLPDHVDLDQLVRWLNKLGAPDIAVRSAERVADDFDARFSARWRHYRYDVGNASTPSPLVAGRAWWIAPSARPVGDGREQYDVDRRARLLVVCRSVKSVTTSLSVHACLE